MTKQASLREVRVRLGLSQAKCATALGVALETFRTWDAGRRPAPDAIVRQARAMKARRSPHERVPLQILADELHVHVRTLRAAAHDGRLAATFGPRPYFGRLTATATRDAAARFMAVWYRRTYGRGQDTPFPPCRVEIVAGVKGRLYVVLPTGVETTLPFACNAPFIQDPARLKIKDPETSPTNRWLLERAGQLAASVLLEWLQPTTGSVASRSEAYSVFPDVDRDDSSLEGTCATAVEEAFDAAIADKPCLLTESGELKAGGEAVLIPAALLEVWPDDQAAAVLDDAARPPLSRHVSAANQQKLIHWNLIEAFTKSKVVELLRAKHLPNLEILKRLRPTRTDDLPGMLERAAFFAHHDILGYLFDVGANPNDRPDGGSSALEACIRHLG